MQLQKHIVRNLTNSSTGTISSEPVYDPYLFIPTASIHDTDTLTELKTKATSSKIIEAVWANNAENHTLGILSKQETTIRGFRSIRLIFFVAREDTDFTPFAESQLYTDVEPFVFREGKTSIGWSDITCMNSGVEPLVYGIESNFYDTNQNYIGMRLTTLKYSLIGPEYWVRFKYTNTTLKIEKSSY